MHTKYNIINFILLKVFCYNENYSKMKTQTEIKTIENQNSVFIIFNKNENLCKPL